MNWPKAKGIAAIKLPFANSGSTQTCLISSSPLLAITGAILG
jgi:hypothetical protein